MTTRVHSSAHSSAAARDDGPAPPWVESPAGAFLMVVAWPLLASAPLLVGLRPLLAAVHLAVVTLAFVYWLCRYEAPSAPARARRRVVLRLSPMRGGALRIAVAVAAGVGACAAATLLYAHVVPEPMAPRNALDRYLLRGPTHLAVVAALVVGLVPVLEEVAFRGLIMTRLERRGGPARAIGITAAVFAVAHMDPWAIPVMLVLGTLCGLLAWATGSVWAAVLLHAAWNAVALTDPLRELAPRTLHDPALLRAAAAVLIVSTAALAAALPAIRRRAPGRRPAGPCLVAPAACEAGDA